MPDSQGPIAAQLIKDHSVCAPRSSDVDSDEPDSKELPDFLDWRDMKKPDDNGSHIDVEELNLSH